MRSRAIRAVIVLMTTGACVALTAGLGSKASLAQPSTASSADIGPLPPVPIPAENPMTPEKVELDTLFSVKWSMHRICPPRSRDHA